MALIQNLDAVYKAITKETFFARKNLKQQVKQFASQNQIKRCFILGNGPSLNWKTVQQLRGQVTFAFNKIYLMEEASSRNWHPNFYMVEDNLVLEQNKDEIIQYCKRFPTMKSFFKFYRKSPYAHISNLFQYNYVDDELRKFSFKPWRFVISGQSVVYSAIQFAVAMGFKEIILLGVDFNFGNYNEKTAKDGVIIGSQDKTHFSVNYRKENEKWNPPNLNKQKQFFQIAQEMTNQIGVKVIDATPNGRLNIFDRIDLKEILENG